MHLFWKPSYYLMRSSHYDQVLTGVLPYHGRNTSKVITDIRAGKRPSRPTNPSRNQWLRGPVWDVITTGWHHHPNQRCELSVMHDAFVMSSQGGADSGDSNNHTQNTETGQRQPGKRLPRIAAFFQFLRDSEPEIQRRVNEMNEVRFATSLLLRLTQVTAS